MKCRKCGFENRNNAKFCIRCGEKLESDPVPPTSGSNGSKTVIGLLIIIIIILIALIGFFAFNPGSDFVSNNTNNNNPDNNSENLSTDAVSESSDDEVTQVVSSSESKSWESIGRYSGDGSGSQKINVPPGKILVKFSAFPIKNYADNHLYVTGPNGAAGGVEWGPTSDVETRSDSFEFTSSSSETFTIDYYETVSWEVEFFRYQ